MKNDINNYWFYVPVFAGCIWLMGVGLLLGLVQFCLGAVICNCGLDAAAAFFLPVLHFFFGG